MEDILDRLTHKKQQLDRYRPMPPALVRNLAEWFTVELTYTSNAIEGNTLTRQETALVLEKGITVGGKNLTEYLEAINHSAALEYVNSLVDKNRNEMREDDILHIHRLILQRIDDTNAGRYRNVPARIAGSTVVLPNPRKVPELMTEFMTWLNSDTAEHSAARGGRSAL